MRNLQRNRADVAAPVVSLTDASRPADELRFLLSLAARLAAIEPGGDARSWRLAPAVAAGGRIQRADS
jgi:hypothetical protein